MSLGSPLKNVDIYPSKVAQAQRYLKQVLYIVHMSRVSFWGR